MHHSFSTLLFFIGTNQNNVPTDLFCPDIKEAFCFCFFVTTPTAAFSNSNHTLALSLPWPQQYPSFQARHLIWPCYLIQRWGTILWPPVNYYVLLQVCFAPSDSQGLIRVIFDSFCLTCSFFCKSKAGQDFKPVTTSWKCFQSRLSTLLPCWTSEFSQDADKNLLFLCQSYLATRRVEISSAAEKQLPALLAEQTLSTHFHTHLLFLSFLPILSLSFPPDSTMVLRFWLLGALGSGDSLADTARPHGYHMDTA